MLRGFSHCYFSTDVKKVIKCLFFLFFFSFWHSDEYRIKPVEEVKYMKNGAEEEQKIAARNQENLVRINSLLFNDEVWWQRCNEICTACLNCSLHTGTRFLENALAIYSLPGSCTIAPISCLFQNKRFFNLDRECFGGNRAELLGLHKMIKF